MRASGDAARVRGAGVHAKAIDDKEVKKSPAASAVGLLRGTEEARTPDLSRVRRALIPAELRFRIRCAPLL